MGKSGVGKDHIYQALLEDETLNLKKVVMYTTRPMRSGEQNGVEYFFTTDEKVQEYKQAGKIVEMRTYQTVQGPWHYLSVDDEQIDLENGHYLVIGTLEVYASYVKHYGKDVVMPIYIEVEDGLRLERAMKREKKQEHPNYKEMCRRFLADCEDFSEEKLQENGITIRYANDTEIEECIEAVKKDILNKMFEM